MVGIIIYIDVKGGVRWMLGVWFSSIMVIGAGMKWECRFHLKIAGESSVVGNRVSGIGASCVLCIYIYIFVYRGQFLTGDLLSLVMGRRGGVTIGVREVWRVWAYLIDLVSFCSIAHPRIPSGKPSSTLFLIYLRNERPGAPRGG